VPRLCELYPGICLTTEEKARETSVRVAQYKNNKAQYKNNNTVTRTMNSKYHRTTKNTGGRRGGPAVNRGHWISGYGGTNIIPNII
jgi:hypothetical protein